MNNRKYEILMDEENTIEWGGRVLHRIKALKDFGDVKKGDIGGFVEKETNLSHEGNCWIYDNAKAMDNSKVYGNSRMYGYSKVYGNSGMYGYSKMFDYSEMYDNSSMNDYSEIYDYSEMYDNSAMYDYSEMHDNSRMYDCSEMYNNSAMYDNSTMYDYSIMYDNSEMYNNSTLKNKTRLYGKLVSSVDDFIEIQNPQGRLVTCVRKGDKILYNVGCQNEIDEETFKDRIEHEDGGLKQNPHRVYYYKIIEMAKLYFGVK